MLYTQRSGGAGNTSVLRSAAASSLRPLGKRFARWTARLDESVLSADSQQSRELRALLRSVNSGETRLNGISSTILYDRFDDGNAHAIDLDKLSAWERQWLRHALERTARCGHPILAWRALEELERFLSPVQRVAIEKDRTDGTGYIAESSLPYLIKRMCMERDIPKRPTLDAHRSAARQIASATYSSWMPYVQNLARLPPAAEWELTGDPNCHLVRHLQLADAVAAAAREAVQRINNARFAIGI